jgi:hypothetical protein
VWQRLRPDGENFGGEVSLNLPLASHHSITSSARASSTGGISMPKTGFAACVENHDPQPFRALDVGHDLSSEIAAIRNQTRVAGMT